MTVKKIVNFADFKKQYGSLQDRLDPAVKRVLESGWFILGEESKAFEKEFAGFLGARHAVACASGTDAIAMALMAVGVGPDHEVITVPNTALPTASAISMTGARPVFVDVDEGTLLMDNGQIDGAVTSKTKAIVPVHLYGNPVDMDPILEIAEHYHLHVVEDACQAHGAVYKEKRVGTLGSLGCFSFYPTKNLGAFGDAGMVVTRDKSLDDSLRLLRNYGQKDRYYHEVPGINSRMDELQAAVLMIKLSLLEGWNRRRREIIARYNTAFAELPLRPVKVDSKGKGAGHLYVIRCSKRDELQGFLETQGVQAWIHYPIPVHLQRAYSFLGLPEGSFPVAEQAAKEILSLPLYPELEDSEQEHVIQAVKAFFDREHPC